jgi:rare lipoprotein A
MSTLKITVLFICIVFVALWVVACEKARALLGKPPVEDSVPLVPVPWKGNASYYSEAYRGKRMANGKSFNPDDMTCAAWEWPLGAVLLVTHRKRTVRVVVTDRGPATKFPDRIIDLSRAAFVRIADTKLGVVAVSVTVEGVK